jgi:hypothetical protein
MPARVADVARRYPGIVWFLVPPADCPDAQELSRRARGRLVPPESVAIDAAADLAPFARPTPTRVVSADEPDGAVANLLDLADASR